MKGPISSVVVVSVLASMMNFGVAHAQSRFSDVPSSNPYYTSIQWLTDNGVIQGYADGTYRPNNPVNRAEMLKMIFLADGNEKNADAALATATLFPDTPKSEWYAKYVALARNRGTVQGYPDGYFRPGNNINKAEAYKIVLKEYYNETTMGYAVSRATLPNSMSIASDVKSTDWFSLYVNFAGIKNFYTTGYTGGNVSGNPFYPAQNLTRGQLAELIYRAKAVSDNFPNNIEDPASIFSSNIIPFTTNLYNYTFAESSGKPSFTIVDDTHPNSLIGYATKYPESLLVSNGDTANTLKFFKGSNQNILDIDLVVKENPDKASIVDFYKKQGTKINYYDKSKSHEDILVNSLPAVWFHGVDNGVSSDNEVVVVQFSNAIAEITDYHGGHQTDGVFSYMVHNFWFKVFGV